MNVRRAICSVIAGLALVLVAGPQARGQIAGVRVTTIAGQRWISVKDLAARYGLILRVPPGQSVYLRSAATTIEFRVDSREARFNDLAIWLHAPLLKQGGKWMITEADASKVVDPLMRSAAYLASRGRRVVVLDPGHGGYDRGARGRRGVEEKRVVLDVAKRARGHLVNAGYKVYLTRESDRFVSLEERCAKAKRWGADVFVSIHINSAPTREPKGLETYVMTVSGLPSTAAGVRSRGDAAFHAGNKQDSANTVLGYYLQRALLAKAKGEDRGVRRARFAVLKSAPCPAALVECGFVSHPAEESRMLSRDHREAIALAVSKGVLDYMAAVNRAKGSSK
jgi:N-acetylmuramoyl-L-alanine amidase